MILRAIDVVTRKVIIADVFDLSAEQAADVYEEIIVSAQGLVENENRCWDFFRSQMLMADDLKEAMLATHYWASETLVLYDSTT